MVPQTATSSKPQQGMTVEQKIQKLRELYADASEIGKTALENGIPALRREFAAGTGVVQTAGRAGLRQGKVSEYTVVVPFVKGGAKRLRGLLQMLEGNFQLADAVGTVHDMRFVFLDNDTKLLFATAYDGDWDPYIDDFASKIPDALDLLFCDSEGWPGIRSPKVKQFLVDHQISAEAWYVNSPNLTAAEAKRLQKVGHAVEELLDKIG